MKVYGVNLVPVFMELRRLGLIESERRFGPWIGRGPDYYRDHGRAYGYAQVAPRTAARLWRQLQALARRLPPGLRGEVEAICVRLERDAAVAGMLAR
ncbi:hypothetical protein [Methylobacterium sp. J-077]|uniref:hypothetical protein n=1 Tax=Methylobacterium sp. J-077 TaxID=2836656 RepID=UPI001FBB80D4|nr:hypothetical protein [Methylobacterium sp. J-077]MCJ2125709.1 hypothetical protein [Methylobacterium sp. J-077]